MAPLGLFVTSAIRSLWDGKPTLRRKSFQLDANKQGQTMPLTHRGP